MVDDAEVPPVVLQQECDDVTMRDARNWKRRQVKGWAFGKPFGKPTSLSSPRAVDQQDDLRSPLQQGQTWREKMQCEGHYDHIEPGQ